MKCRITIFLIYLFLNHTLYSYKSDLNLDNNDNHCQDTNTSDIMFSLQTGYAWIDTKDAHMENDSGLLIGLHAMHHNTLEFFDEYFSLAFGIHKTWSKEPHIGAMVGLMYKINDNLSVSFMPGYVWMKHSEHNHIVANAGMPNMPMNMSNKENWESEYSNHIELHSEIKIFSYLLNTSLSLMTSKSHSLYSFAFNFNF